MATEGEITRKFWKHLEDDRIVMLGLAGEADGHSQPMAAQLDDERGAEDPGPIWFFTSTDTDLSRALQDRHRAVLHFAAKGHELFATVHGELAVDDNRATLDRLWNRFVAAWFEGGKQDPRLQLLRFDPQNAQIWLNDNSLFAGVKILLGKDPKRDYQEKVARVDLGDQPH